MAYDPAFKHALELEMQRARFDLRLKAGQTTKLSTMQRRITLPNGTHMDGFDLYAVDVDHDGVECGKPVLMNDVPLPCLEEAVEFAENVRRGRRWFSWRGARASLIGEDARMPPRVVVETTEERASPRLFRGRA